MPSTMFKGKSNLGYRGDSILQLDWAVGEIMKQLESLGIAKNTIIIFSSDNGPVLDDGYQDEAVEKLNGHTPAGVLRGGKYSLFEGGTRVPLLVSWPGKTKQKVSDALISQVDFMASFSKLLNVEIEGNTAVDSEDVLNTLLGKTDQGRTVLVEQGILSLGIVKGNWKYIEPNKGPALNKVTNIELGNSLQPQLYDLKNDIGEKNNLADKYPEVVKELSENLQKIKARTIKKD
jgi:arylsulfatase A-like enzyme